MLQSFLLDPDLEYRFLLLGSPQLWEVMSPQEAVAWVHRYSQLQYKGVNAADALTLEVQQRQQLALQQEAQKAGGVQVRGSLLPGLLSMLCMLWDVDMWDVPVICRALAPATSTAATLLPHLVCRSAHHWSGDPCCNMPGALPY
jgi:hypothetical protein